MGYPGAHKAILYLWSRHTICNLDQPEMILDLFEASNMYMSCSFRMKRLLIFLGFYHVFSFYFTLKKIFSTAYTIEAPAQAVMTLPLVPVLPVFVVPYAPVAPVMQLQKRVSLCRDGGEFCE